MLSKFCIILTLLVSSFSDAADRSIPRNVHEKSRFVNSRIRFECDKVGHVAFIGGSITEMNGYRPMVMNYLQERFPETKFQFTDAGISSTCSTAGAFRLQTDVLEHGKVDLFFIEFAVNDDQDAMHSYEQALRGMEGIVRQTLSHSPHAELVFTYFVNPGMLEKLQAGEVPTSIAAHQKVAKHYGITTIHLAQEVADRIDGGTLTWKEYGGVHPAPAGNRIPASMISKTLNTYWSEPLSKDAKLVECRLPEPLDSESHDRGQYLSHDSVTAGTGWSRKVPNWKNMTGQVRSRHKELELWVCEQPGLEARITFTGTAFGVECLAGPDAGTIEYSVDGEKWQSFNLSHRFSKGLHYPRTVVLTSGLEDEKHEVKVRLADKQSDFGQKPAVRIIHFVVNATDE